MSIILSVLAALGTFALASLFPAAIVAALGILAITLVMKLLSGLLEKSKLEPIAYKLIKSVVRIVLYVLLALVVASKLGLDVTGVVALASVLTLAVSLSLQNALANVIGGFTLLYTKPFHAGDFVDIAGQSGTVREIGLTYTKLITPDNKLISIPNSTVSADKVVNYTTTGTRRVDINVSASYDVAPEKVLEALKEAAKVPTALPDPEIFSGIVNYGESAIEYTVRVWCTADDYWTTMFDVNHRIKQVFDEQSITMTYPHLNVHLDK